MRIVGGRARIVCSCNPFVGQRSHIRGRRFRKGWPDVYVTASAFAACADLPTDQCEVRQRSRVQGKMLQQGLVRHEGWMLRRPQRQKRLRQHIQPEMRIISPGAQSEYSR